MITLPPLVSSGWAVAFLMPRKLSVTTTLAPMKHDPSAT
jgi:hypothetical protein